MAKKRRSSFKRTQSRKHPTVTPKPAARCEPSLPTETLFRFKTSKKKLAKMPDEARTTLIWCGHIANQITDLHRLLLFTMKEHSDPVLKEYANGQTWTIVRMLIGVVGEGVDVIQNRIFRSNFSRDYLRQLSHPDVDAARKLVGKAELLRHLRNEHAFHNPSKESLDKAFANMIEGDDWAIMMGRSRHSMFFSFAHNVTARAMMEATGEAEPEGMVNAIMQTALDGAQVLLGFFEQLFLALKDLALFDDHEKVLDMSVLPSAMTVAIPPLCKDGA